MNYEMTLPRLGWPSYGTCAKFCAMDDLKWRIAYL